MNHHVQRLELGKEEIEWLVKKLKGMSFFEGLRMGVVEDILPSFARFRYPRGYAVVRQGKPGTAFFVIFKGKVSIAKGKWLGLSSEKVADLGPGNFFGEMSLVESTPCNATVSTVEDSEIFVLLKQDFDYILSKNPALAGHMRKSAAFRNFEMQQRGYS